jgi:hypothetical protein
MGSRLNFTMLALGLAALIFGATACAKYPVVVSTSAPSPTASSAPSPTR